MYSVFENLTQLLTFHSLLCDSAARTITQFQKFYQTVYFLQDIGTVILG